MDGLNFILDTWDGHYARKDASLAAYALGTTHHETGSTMQPINEYGGARYFFRIYDIEGDRPRVARRLGNIYPGDGILFHGRGYVQFTGRSNYAKMQRRFGIHLTSLDKAANRALQSGLAAKIMFYGMEHGVFNGKKFDDYFAKDRDHWVQARSIINPGDKSRLVADYARDYYAAISCTR